MTEELNPNPEQKPLGRRAFMTDVAAVGAVLLGSVTWAMSARTAEAGPTPVPHETDRVLPPGMPPPPRPTSRPTSRPTPSPRPSASASGRPSECDRVSPAGGVRPAPRPVENDIHDKPGKVAAPPPTPTPKKR